MKELFGINCTENGRNNDIDGLGYEAARVSGDLEARIDAHNENAEELESSAGLPPVLGVVRWLCAAAFVIFAGGIVKALLDGLTLEQVYHNVPWMFWLLPVLGAAWLILTLVGKKRGRETADSREFSDAKADLDALNKETEQQLGIPEDAREIDLLVYRYKDKNGEHRIKEQLFGHFIRCGGCIFRDNGCFCISDGLVRYDIPLGDIEGIEIIKKKFYMNDWGKEGSLKDYREFVVENTDNLARVWLRSVCVMRLSLKGEEFAFRFPTYELAAVESVSGITADGGR